MATLERASVCFAPENPANAGFFLFVYTEVLYCGKVECRSNRRLDFPFHPAYQLNIVFQLFSIRLPFTRLKVS